MRGKKSIGYYLVILFALIISFFTNDFGLVDIQKTALVIAIGVDRQEEEFVVTTQIALPKPEVSGEQSTQIVSKGKTVSEALEKINAKTGWYPKLVFCQLIVLGESFVSRNVFEGLNYFLRSEYISDDCLLATCEGSAQELLNSQNPVETFSGLAISKTLSSHAEEVGTVLPTTLREFSQGYYGASKSGYLPILKIERAQEVPLPSGDQSEQKMQKSRGQVRDERILMVASQEPSGNSDNNGSGKDGQGQGQGKGGQEKVFSAGETALFKNGARVGDLTKEETLAFAFVKSKLRLAPYSLKEENEEYSLSVRRNSVKTKLSLEDKASPKFEISLKITAGLSDDNRSDSLEELIISPQISKSALNAAEQKLQEQVTAVFNKACSVDCDIFECIETLRRKEYGEYQEKKDTLLAEISPIVKVEFKTVR